MQLLENPSPLQLDDILLLAQFPPWEDMAVPYALGLAREHGARMQVVHALPTHASQKLTQVLQGGAFRRSWRELVFDAGASRAIIDPATELRPGDMRDQRNFDLAVVSYGGRPRASREAVGRELEQMFRTTDCPVIVLGPAVHRDWAPRTEPATILHATDFSPHALAAAQHAFAWAQQYQSWITLLHVIEGIGAWTEHERARLEEPFRQWLGELVPEEAPSWCEVEHRVELGNPTARIVGTAEQLHADLIVIGLAGMDTVAPDRPGATAMRIISAAPCPVLVVRDYMETAAKQPVADGRRQDANLMAA